MTSTWESWGNCLKTTQRGQHAASEWGIYSLQGDCWFSSNEQVDAAFIQKCEENLRPEDKKGVFTSVMFRNMKYIKLGVDDENVTKFMSTDQQGLVIGLGQAFVIVAECCRTSLNHCVVAVGYVIEKLNESLSV